MSLAGLTILVVEDEPIIGLALEDMLIEADADPILVSTVDSALTVIAQRAIDAAILDVNVHGIRSYPVASELVALGKPLVFASGYGDAVHPPEFAHIPTITKPYALPDILRALA